MFFSLTNFRFTSATEKVGIEILSGLLDLLRDDDPVIQRIAAAGAAKMSLHNIITVPMVSGGVDGSDLYDVYSDRDKS